MNIMKFLALLSIIGVYFGALYYCGRGLDFSGSNSKVNESDLDSIKEDSERDDDAEWKRRKRLNDIVTLGDIENMHDIGCKAHWDD